MTTNKIKIAMAELDGLTSRTKEIEHLIGYQWTETVTVWIDVGGNAVTPPRYAESHDAIQAFCARQSEAKLCAIITELERIVARDWKTMTNPHVAFCNPYQWCEAILRAAGKWEEAE